jgi:enoyl-CoA hydratase/carnithine racemase
MNKSTAAASPADATNSPTVHLESLDQGAIAVLTLDDPKRANAMSREMGDAFTSRVRAIQDDPALRVVIIRGAGKDFSIGGHRDMLISLGSGKLNEAELHDFMLGFYNRWLPMLDLPVPIIAALQGDCIGVAPVFACIPDIALADDTLNLQITFAGLGLYPGMALPPVLVRKVGEQQAVLLMMASEAISGREAERIGLVARCVRSGKAFEEALKVAREISAAAPAVVRALKKSLRVKREDLLPELEANAAQQAKDFQSEEYRRRVPDYLPNHYD